MYGTIFMGENSSLNQGHISVVLCGRLGTQVEEFHRGGIRRVALDVRYSPPPVLGFGGLHGEAKKQLPAAGILGMA